MEENRRFSWSNLFIKVIIVIIFVLFTVWLLSLSNKDLSTSLDVLTDNIFSQNIEKMKNVGKEYFTTERLPKKIGGVKTITLEKMYEKKLILELKDKFGKSCNAEDSYISIEKMETEYQMKVKLVCGQEEDYVVVIMGCYDYCDTDICEKKEPEVTVSNKGVEYEYKKTTGGYWTDYGKWSEWSKVAVTKNDYRQVETKIEKEDYSYDKTVTELVYSEFEATCPSGYKKTSDGTKCYKEVSSTETKNPTCPKISGYTLSDRDGFECSYSMSTTSTKNPTCPKISGYTLVDRNGFECNYGKSTISTKEPICPTVEGYTLVDKEGFECNYSKSTISSKEPICPTVEGYTYNGRSGFTCNYKKAGSNYTLEYVSTKKGDFVPADTDKYVYKQIDADYVYDCGNVCVFKWIYTYEVYKKVYSNDTTTKTASCPEEYTKSGSTCIKEKIDTTIKTASCPKEYTKSGSTCIKEKMDTTIKTASCPKGYVKSGNKCSKTTTDTTIKTAICPIGYTKSGNKCSKKVVDYEYKNLVNVCPSGYDKSSDGNKCSKEVSSVVKITGIKEVIYYRYRIREYVGGTTDYKWSTSNEDSSLLNAGYKLTGRTR